MKKIGKLCKASRKVCKSGFCAHTKRGFAAHKPSMWSSHEVDMLVEACEENWGMMCWNYNMVEYQECEEWGLVCPNPPARKRWFNRSRMKVA